MMATEPPPDLGQALHDWHAALARGDRQARLAARLLVDILVAGGLDERLEEIQARQQREPMARPSPKRPAAVLDDTLWLATQNVTISAELYRRLEVLEQRVTEIHAASQAAQTLLHRQHPAPPPPAPLWRQLAPGLLRLLGAVAAYWLLLVLLAVTLIAIDRPKPAQPLLPPPAARLLAPPAELPPEPRSRREEPPDAI